MNQIELPTDYSNYCDAWADFVPDEIKTIWNTLDYKTQVLIRLTAADGLYESYGYDRPTRLLFAKEVEQLT